MALQSMLRLTTLTAWSSTSGALVFVAQSANTCTPALTAKVATPGGPAPGRFADLSPITSHTPHTPLQPQVFARFLSSHPDQAFVLELIRSLTYRLHRSPHSPHCIQPSLCFGAPSYCRRGPPKGGCRTENGWSLSLPTIPQSALLRIRGCT